jgi:FRG domain
MECCNDKDLLIEPHPLEGTVLDIDTPSSQMAIMSLPNNQIRTMSDIETLKKYVAFKYTKGIRLYRGHESNSYKIESTIVRHVKGKNKDCSVQDVREAELKGYNLFCSDVFKEEWLHNKSNKSDYTLFAMSIGRHLGLPCRLIDVTASLETAIWFAVMNPHFYNVDGEIVLIVLDKDDILDTNQSPFKATKLSYAHEPFMTDSLDELPLGEQRRFVQNGHFIWVNDKSLLNEEQAISDYAYHIERFTIPRKAKLGLAIELYRDVYSGCAYQSDIAKIKWCI